MNDTTRSYLELHIAVFLFGFTAILGDLIQLSALVIVWWRVLLTSVSLLLFIRVFRLFRETPRQLLLQYAGIGVLVGIHWLTFYGAIKLSNASITLVCMATTSFFTSILEPLLLRQAVKWFEIGLGLLVIPGMVLVVNGTDFSMLPGIIIGLISALLASIFAILNKKLVNRSDTFSITFLELGSAWLFLSILLPFYLLRQPELVILPARPLDWSYIITLALLCTTLAYVLALRSLRYLSAFASNLTVNLEPVYGILLAWVLLNENEELAADFYWGVLVILLAVFSYPLVKRLMRKRHPELFPTIKNEESL